jgi:predicted alpha/beta hydrolase family esterase
MKYAAILHATDRKPDEIWIPWLKQQLEARGYEVWTPELPENHTPDYRVYNDFLFSRDWDFTDNIVIGHSSGAVSVLNLLMDERCPKIKLGVMVSGWAGGMPNGHFDEGQFDALFHEDGFDFVGIKANADSLAFLHSDDDPYCPLEQAEFLAAELDSPLRILYGAGHISGDMTELPELWDMIEEKL